MEQPGLRYCDVLYEASRRNRKMAKFSSEDVELETNDDIRCMQPILRENVEEGYAEVLKIRLNMDEDYVEFLKLYYNYDRYSQSYTNECGNDGCPDEVGVEDEDDLQYKMFDDNTDEIVEDEADPQYKMFDDSSDEDEVDPQYKMFLANAKPDGQSYVVKVDTEDGSSVLMKYEKESGCDYECEHLYCEKQKDTEMLKDAVCEKNLLNISSEDEEEGQKLSRTIPGYDSNRSVGDVDVVLEPFNHISQRKNGISSQKLSIGKCGASKRQGKCGTKTQSDEEPMMTKNRKPVNLAGKRKASDVDEDYMLLLLKRLQCENRESDEEAMVAKESKPVNFVGKKKASVIDEDYILFLKSLQCENRGMKGSLGNSYSFECEAAEDGVEILDSNSATLENVGSFNLTGSSAKHHESVEDRYPQTSVQSKFRQKVMDLLKKPYNRIEYQELWKAVKRRKPMHSNMETRNGGAIFYETQKLGKSYLNHYEDLGKKLKKVNNDKMKELKILRGFFFWLQHLTQEGAFKPWTDNQFLALVAESS